MSQELKDEYKVWKAVKEGIPLSEVLSWDLDDLDKYTSFLDMGADHESAFSSYKKAEAKREQQRRNRK